MIPEPALPVPGARPDAEPGAEAAERYLVFALGSRRIGLPVGRLRELAEAPKGTRLPFVPPWIRGLTQLRGEVIALLDLFPLLGWGELPDRPSNRMLLLCLPDGEAAAGLLVERVIGVVAVPAGAVSRVSSPEPDLLPLAPYFGGGFEDAGHGAVALLDVDRLLAAVAVG